MRLSLMMLASATYDYTGAVDYMQTFNTAVENFAALTVGGGTSANYCALLLYIAPAEVIVFTLQGSGSSGVW
jgi:hypothetical protein